MGLRTNLQSLNLTFNVEGKQLTVTSSQITFAANGIPRASVELAVGRVNGFVDAGSITGIEYGKPCEIRGDGSIIFSGVVLDVYPRVIASDGEAASIVIEMLGRTSKLNTGTRTTSPLIPADFADKSVYSLLATNVGQNLNKFLLDQNNTDFISNLKNALIEIMNTSGSTVESETSKLARSIFGEVNTEFLTTINEVQGVANWKWSKDSYAALVNGVNNYLTLDDSMGKTVLENIKDICDQFRLSFVEFGETIIIVPHSPFYTSDLAYQMGGAEYSELAMEPLQRKNMLMGVMVFAGSNVKPTLEANGLPFGIYKLTANAPLGAVLATTVPAFIGAKLNTNAGAQEPGIIPSEEDRKAGVGDEWAKFLTYNGLYADRRVRVTCPYVRTDIAPLTAIRLDYPLDREIGDMLPSKYIYGVVNTITINVDPSAEVAQTTFTIDYVRSDLEQERIDADYTGHPFFDTNWTGTG
jgi:hypothetical protein